MHGRHHKEGRAVMLGSLGESEGGVRERTPRRGWSDCSVLVRGWGGVGMRQERGPPHARAAVQIGVAMGASREKAILIEGWGSWPGQLGGVCGASELGLLERGWRD